MFLPDMLRSIIFFNARGTLLILRVWPLGFFCLKEIALYIGDPSIVCWRGCRAVVTDERDVEEKTTHRPYIRLSTPSPYFAPFACLLIELDEDPNDDRIEFVAFLYYLWWNLNF